MAWQLEAGLAACALYCLLGASALHTDDATEALQSDWKAKDDGPLIQKTAVPLTTVCPWGYYQQGDNGGDLAGFGIQKIGNTDTNNKCAGHCNANVNCLSFEYNAGAKECILNDKADPNVLDWPDQLFCTKASSTFLVQALDLSFESSTSRTCPLGWTCTGIAQVCREMDRHSNYAPCYHVGLSNAEGEHYLMTGDDADIGTATSPAFRLPADVCELRLRRCGGADGPGSGLYVRRQDDNSVLCMTENGANTNRFFPDTCTGLDGHAGEVVYIHVRDGDTNGWGKIFVDDMRFFDCSGTELTTEHQAGQPTPKPPYKIPIGILGLPDLGRMAIDMLFPGGIDKLVKWMTPAKPTSNQVEPLPPEIQAKGAFRDEQFKPWPYKGAVPWPLLPLPPACHPSTMRGMVSTAALFRRLLWPVFAALDGVIGALYYPVAWIVYNFVAPATENRATGLPRLHPPAPFKRLANYALNTDGSGGFVDFFTSRFGCVMTVGMIGSNAFLAGMLLVERINPPADRKFFLNELKKEMDMAYYFKIAGHLFKLVSFSEASTRACSAMPWDDTEYSMNLVRRAELMRLMGGFCQTIYGAIWTRDCKKLPIRSAGRVRGVSADIMVAVAYTGLVINGLAKIVARFYDPLNLFPVVDFYGMVNGNAWMRAAYFFSALFFMAEPLIYIPVQSNKKFKNYTATEMRSAGEPGNITGFLQDFEKMFASEVFKFGLKSNVTFLFKYQETNCVGSILHVTGGFLDMVSAWYSLESVAEKTDVPGVAETVECISRRGLEGEQDWGQHPNHTESDCDWVGINIERSTSCRGDSAPAWCYEERLRLPCVL